jgi:Acyclic terpene utilisation family protein AtuA
MKTIRVGSGAGYSGDRIEPTVELAEKGGLDYLVFECLGERTIALAQKAKIKDPGAGYDPLLAARMRAVLTGNARPSFERSGRRTHPGRRLSCLARNGHKPGSPRGVESSGEESRPVRSCVSGDRGAAVLRPDQAMERPWDPHAEGTVRLTNLEWTTG